MANHTLTAVSVKFKSKTGSRNRIRIPVRGARFNGIKPGSRVNVKFTPEGVKVTPLKKDETKVGTYKVERDGAIRFPAHKFNLPSTAVGIDANKYIKTVVLM